MKGKDRQNIFSKFNLKARKRERKQQEAIEQAKLISKKMIEGKEKAKEDFLKKLYENAVAMNKAREEWEEIGKDDKEEENC